MSYSPSGPFAVGVCDLEYWNKDQSKEPDTKVTAKTHLVGRIFYPCNPEALKQKRYQRACWLPSWTYARGYGAFLTSWGGASLLKSLLKPAIIGISYSLGHQVLIDNFMHAPILEGQDPFPVVVFSHGIGGTRNAYSGICSELGSAGFVVLAVEHADGTAATVQMAGNLGSRFYGGWLSEERRLAQTRYRMGEVATAVDLLSALQRRSLPEGLKLSGGLDPIACFGGRLDLSRVSVVGHSYGGATITALTAQDSRFRAGIALDPWWGALPGDSAALRGWETGAPLLVMGSHAWNTPSDSGRLFCDGTRQDQVFKAAASRAGAVHLVIEGSAHDTFNDAVQLVALRYRSAMHYVRSFKKHEGVEELDASLALPLVSNASLAFLRRHLALTGRQLAPLEAATRANSQRIYAAETRLAAEASAAEEKAGGKAGSVAVEAHGGTGSPAQPLQPVPGEEPGSRSRAGSLAAAVYLQLEEGANEASAAAQTEAVAGGLGGGSSTAGAAAPEGAAQQSALPVAAETESPADSERGALESVCKGHIWKLDVYGL